MSESIVASIPLRYNGERVNLYPLEKETIRLVDDLANRDCAMAIFYPNEVYDCVVPFCLEFLYETNVISKQNRSSLVLFGGKHTSRLRKSYLNLFFGEGNFVTDLFGLCLIGAKRITSIKVPGIKKDIKDKFLFSSSYTNFPPDSITEQIGSCVIIAPPYGIDTRVEGVVSWCKKNDIKNIFIFDFLPTAKKITFYKRLGLLIYGWKSQEITFLSESADSKYITPFSDPSRIIATALGIDLETINVEHEINKILDGIHSTIGKLKRFETFTGSKEYTILKECRYILRKLESLTSPIADYDAIQSNFREVPLCDRINFMIDVCKAGEFLAPSEISELKFYLTEARAALYRNCPKFDLILSEIQKSIALGQNEIIFFASDHDKDAFLEYLDKNVNKITAHSLEAGRIELSTFYCDLGELESKSFENAVFSTYPPLSRTLIFSKIQAKNKKIVLYRREKFCYELFSSIYSQIENLFFGKEMREKAVMSIRGELKYLEEVKLNLILPSISEVQVLEHKKQTEIISLLTEIEDLSEPDPVIDEELLSNAVKSNESIYTDCLALVSVDGNKIFVNPNKIIQKLSQNDKIKYKKASELCIGDTVLLINRGVKQTLNDLILSKAEEYTKLKVLKSLVKIWVGELRRGMENYKDSEITLLHKLRDAGSKITNEITIKYWREGYVIGPRDKRNISRIADIYSSLTLRENLHGIRIAIKKLRGLRRAIIKRVKTAMIEGYTEDIEMLGIKLYEFQQYLELFQIKSIENIKKMPISRLNVVDDLHEL